MLSTDGLNMHLLLFYYILCEKNEDVIRVCMQVKELVEIRDTYVDGVLNRGECSEIIECLCTE